MRRPSFAQLPSDLAGATLAIVTPLRRAGHAAYLVGGAVRDLALEVEPHDVDVATSAPPEAVERLFPVAHAVGRAFGTVVVRAGTHDVQVTTFRTEGDYADARRPGSVAFGETVEEDAARRDFTCNALYLDAERDEVLDPTGGLADLAAHRLRCVGVAGERFAEDGLRLLRLARLAAAFDLAVEPTTREAARTAADALRGVSPERVRGELERMADGPRPATALELLDELELLERMPGCGALAGEAVPGAARRIAAVRRLGQAPGPRLMLATLLRPVGASASERASDALTELRPSRELLDGCTRLWTLVGEWEACLESLANGTQRRSREVRLAREADWRAALACWDAWLDGPSPPARDELQRRLEGLDEAALRPAPWITSRELSEAGIARGPAWGRLLCEAEDLQLDGVLGDRDAALRWLAQQRDQVGGKTRRKA